MGNSYASKRHGEVVVNVLGGVPFWFSTWATIQSLESAQCGKLFDKICDRNDEYSCGEAKNFDGKYVRISSDAYVSRDYATSLNREDAGDHKAWLLEKMGKGDCLSYRSLTDSFAVLNESGELQTLQYDTNTETTVAGESEIAVD